MRDPHTVEELARALRESEQRFWALVNGTRDGVFMVDLDGRFVFVNDFIAASSGYPKQAFVGRHYLELIRPDDHDRVRGAFERTLSGEAVAPYELAYRTATGVLMWVEVNSALVEVDGSATGVLSISRNIQLRKAMEDQLRESEEKYRTLIETLPHAVAIIQDDRIAFVNDAGRRLTANPTGEAGLVERFVTEWDSPRVSEFHRRRVEGDLGVPQRYRTSIRGVAGDVPVEVSIRPIHYRGRPALQALAIDLTEQQVLEAQVRQSQKLEALGTLAGGIAHDFNNVLAGILGAAEMLKERSSDDSDARQSADVIVRAARRATALTRQLLGFARKQDVVRQAVDLKPLLAEVVEILARTLPKNVEVRQRCAFSSVPVLGDPTQLEQVLMNLAMNAADAMPEGGEMTFAIEQGELGDATLRESFGIGAGMYWRLTVQDSGLGIPPDELERVFEPFFTTKPMGKGSGMGLAVVYGIVRSHLGAVEVTSSPGHGTTFTVYLPVAVAHRSTVEEAAEPLTPATGLGVVLVVDDEGLVRSTASGLLGYLGYGAVVCGSAEEALACYVERRDEINAALIDVSMPLKNGWTCLDELRGISATLPVVMTSGRPADSQRIATMDRRTRFLPKPYGLRELGAALADVVAHQRDGEIT